MLKTNNPWNIKLLLVLVFIITTQISCSEFNTSNKSPSETTGMFNHELSHYEGKALNELLSDSKVDLLRYVCEDEPVGKLRSVILIFENNVKIRAHFNSFQYVKQFSEKRDWDFSLLKKETVSKYSIAN